MLSRAAAPFHGDGGLERHVGDLVRHLCRAGVRVTLVTRAPITVRPWEEAVSGPRLRVRFVPYVSFPWAGRRGTTVLDRSTAYLWFGWRAGRLVADLVRSGGIQLVHAHGASALGYARARGRDWIGTVPLVLNPHGLEEFGPPGASRPGLKPLAYRPLRWAVRRCAGVADRVIATDVSLVANVTARLAVPQDRVRIVPNAVDLDRIGCLTGEGARREQRRQLGVEPEDVVLLSVGRLEANKGLELLVSALAALRHARSSTAEPILGTRWRWVVVGDGPLRRRLERAIAAASLDAHVRVTGRVSEAELHGWYEAADLFVHPTLYEGSSIVTLEAMAHRRPVVATTAGGLPDKVQPGRNGWLAEPGRVDALAQVLREALEARHRWPLMGEASRTIVERDFAWSAIIGRWLDLYREVLTGVPRRYGGRELLVSKSNSIGDETLDVDLNT